MKNKRKTKNEFFVPHNVLEEEKFINMKLSSQILYIHLCRLRNRLNKDGFYRHVEKLTKETGLNKKTIQNAKKELLKTQYIVVEKNYCTVSGNRLADIYYLNNYI